jgi:hypothetical protein
MLAVLALLPAAPLCATVIAPGGGPSALSSGTIPNATLEASAEHPWDYTGTITIPGPGGSTNHYSFQGFLREQVWRETASGLLDFQYQFVVTTRTNDGPQAVTFFPGIIRNFTLSGFPASVSTDIFTTSSAGTAFTPTTADRLTLPTISFNNFTGSDLPITASATDLLSGSFAIHTNATSFDANGSGTITFSVGESSPVQTDTLFEPSFGAAVPEPMSLALLPLSLVALAVRFRRR